MDRKTKSSAKTRARLLKRLRQEHKEGVARAQKLLREQKALRQQICKATRDAPKTVPEIAETTGIPAEVVLWHVTAMKKYGVVTEVDVCGSYYTYQRVKD